MDGKKYIAKKAVNIFGYTVAALVGLAAAVVLFLSVMIVKVDDSSMLPEIEPGSRVIAVRTHFPADIGVSPSVKVGDLVVYRVPYYEIDGKGVYVVRRVSGMNGELVEVSSEEGPAALEKDILSKEKILGKVIYNG